MEHPPPEEREKIIKGLHDLANYHYYRDFIVGTFCQHGDQCPAIDKCKKKHFTKVTIDEMLRALDSRKPPMPEASRGGSFSTGVESGGSPPEESQ